MARGDTDTDDEDSAATFRVTNVDATARAADVEEHFRRFGVLQHVHVVHDATTGRSRGVAFVTFKSFPTALFQALSAPADAAAPGGHLITENGPAFSFMNRFVRLQRVSFRDVEEAMAKSAPTAVTSTNATRSVVRDRSTLSTMSEISRQSTLQSDSALPAADNVVSFEVVNVQIGTFVGENVFYAPHEVASAPEMRLEFNGSLRRLRWVLKATDAEYKFEVSFLDVYDYVLVEQDQEQSIAGDRSVWLTLDISATPKMYSGKLGTVEEFGVWEWRRTKKTVWHRIRAVNAPYDNIDFGRHLAYRFRLAISPADEVLQKLRSVSRFFRQMPDNTPPTVGTRLRICTELSDPWENLDDMVDELPFNIFYLLKCLVSNGWLPCYLVSKPFLDLICRSPASIACAALELMVAGKQKIFHPSNTFTEMCAAVPNNREKKAIPAHCLLVRKLYVTPTRLLFAPPTIELGNRVLRKHIHCVDNFLRVAFADENCDKHLEGSSLADEIVHRIRSVLESGIAVGTRHYDFLAFSSSQLREHSCWFFAPHTDTSSDCSMEKCVLDAGRIRLWMGDFAHIRSVGKYAARLGQCFSSATPIEASKFPCTEIADVERNGYCFSDGIGKISQALCNRINSELSLNPPSCAFQVRMQGYKGVLCCDPSIDAKGEAPLQFRPSMKKFTNDHASLDIIRASRYGPAYLNHQIITLLTSMRVDDTKFLRLQRDMQRRLDLMFNDRAVAVDILAPYASGNLTLTALVKLLRAGVPMDHGPFMTNMIKLFQCRKLRDVKFKARIHVQDGVQLMGVLDETGTLEYGQLFVQYTVPDGSLKEHPSGHSDVKVVKGTVLMAKMPAVHSGDVRVLTCVDHAALRHYRDVVVFPQKGPRPHTYEASGSDLDGDVYFVTWNTSLIPPIRNYQPLDYSAPAPLDPGREVEIGDIKEFMVDYIRNDNLGLIAVAHKVHADLSLKGAMSDKCIQLARLHSTAVDFPKTGIPAAYDPQRFFVQAFPDFVGRSSKPMYESKKALGKLYREVHERSFRPAYDFRVDSRFLVPGYDTYVADAIYVKKSWDFAIRRLMCQYNTRSEFELVSQLILSRRKVKGEFEMCELIQELLRKLTAQYMRRFWTAIGTYTEVPGKDDVGEWRPVKSSAAYQKASAWYLVSYDRRLHPTDRASRRQAPLFSFPWLNCCDLLCEIFAHNVKRAQEPDYRYPDPSFIAQPASARRNSQPASVKFTNVRQMAELGNITIIRSRPALETSMTSDQMETRSGNNDEQFDNCVAGFDVLEL